MVFIIVLTSLIKTDLVFILKTSSKKQPSGECVDILSFIAGLRVLRERAALAARAAHGGGVRADTRGGRGDGPHVLPEGHPGMWVGLHTLT